jgi:hypothetical protein
MDNIKMKTFKDYLIESLEESADEQYEARWCENNVEFLGDDFDPESDVVVYHTSTINAKSEVEALTKLYRGIYKMVFDDADDEKFDTKEDVCAKFDGWRESKGLPFVIYVKQAGKMIYGDTKEEAKFREKVYADFIDVVGNDDAAKYKDGPEEKEKKETF